MRHSILLTILFSVFALSSCSPTVIGKRGGIQLCGSTLVETLLMVCGGEVYSPEEMMGKRSIVEQERDFPRWFFDTSIPRTDGLANFSMLSRRQAQGIVDECCYKSCSFSHLASYCGK